MTNSKNSDSIISPAINSFVKGIENQGGFLSCYLTGSYAEGYHVKSVSDIDLTIISEGEITEAKQLKLNKLIKRVDKRYNVCLDVSFVSQSNEPGCQKLSFLGIAFREAVMSAKLAGKLIWGKDVIASIPTLSHEEYLKSTENIPFEFSDRIRGYKGLQFPLEFPDHRDEYFGYLGKHADGTTSTKPLVSLLTWIGTATVAQLAGIQVGNKQQCVVALSKVDAQKGLELSRIFDLCRRDWRYRIPETPEGQADLKKICKNALSWENEYHQRFFSNVIGHKI